MTPIEQFVGAIAVVFVPLLSAIAAVIWRSSAKLRDNTNAVARLAGAIEGTAIDVGIERRVRVLEDWKVREDTRKELKAGTDD